MRVWSGEHFAPFERTRTFSLKGSSVLMPPSLSSDLTRIHVRVAPDYIRPLLGVPHRDYAVCPSPAAILDASDLAIPPPETFESTLPVAPPVSENLLAPLVAGVVGGKDYRGKALPKETQPTLFDTSTDGARKKSRLRKAYLHFSDDSDTPRYDLDVIANPSLAIWDLLFPLLKPPLHIDSPDILDLPNELYPFQIEGVRSLIASESFLLADEMGTGKTVITSVALRILFHEGKVRCALIVCPKSILGVWDTHLRDWASTLSVTVVNGLPSVRRIDWRCPAHVYITTYDTLRNDAAPGENEARPLITQASETVRFDAIVLDEAHAIKNPSSGRTKAVRQISQTTTYRWALTGTPIQNSMDDLRSIFEVLRPSLFPTTPEPISAKEARCKIEPYFLRRRKQDVFRELPAKVRSDEWMDLDGAQEAEYKAMLAGGQQEFRSGTKEFSRIHVFALLQKLKRICNFAGGMGESPKSAALLEQLEEIAANDKKVLVFSQYKKDGIEKLEPLLQPYGVVTITGDSSDTARGNAVERFQNDSAIRVLLATTKTAGEGLTLTAASYVVHFDHWWNPAVSWQAEDRAHRLGQEETVNVYSYWMRGTVEERIRSILERKGLLFEEVVDSLSETEFDDALTIDDLLEVLDMERDAVRIPVSENRRQQAESGIAEVLGRLNTVDPFEFEDIVKRVFQDVLGYANARVTKRSADGGIDIEATRPVPGGIERVAVQCKRKASVGPNVARELLGVLSADPSITKGFVVTSGRLTRACRDFCHCQGRLEGIDGVQLARWVHDHKIDIG